MFRSPGEPGRRFAPSLVWVVWGLAPVLLGITGLTIWLVTWRSRRNRAFRKRLDRATADEPATVPSSLPSSLPSSVREGAR